MKDENHNQPVAYDADGNPLYSHPPGGATGNGSVHVSRPLEVKKMNASEQLKAKHESSLARFPHLNLSEGEYIISAVRRHPIGLAIPVISTTFLIIIVLVIMLAYSNIAQSLENSTNVNLPQAGDVMLVGTLFIVLFAIGGYIATWVYRANKFFLTNESVIQETQTSLFAKHEQTVSLQNIEDASYRQSGLLQTILDYGSIRLSTEGDETTYRFRYVYRPKQQIALLNNAVESFKLGRAVEDN